MRGMQREISVEYKCFLCVSKWLPLNCTATFFLISQLKKNGFVDNILQCTGCDFFDVLIL